MLLPEDGLLLAVDVREAVLTSELRRRVYTA